MVITLGDLIIWLIIAGLVGFIGEPYLNGVPLITSILAAAVLVALWSAFVYRHAYGYYSRYYYRRGGYVRRPRRYRWF